MSGVKLLICTRKVLLDWQVLNLKPCLRALAEEEGSVQGLCKTSRRTGSGAVEARKCIRAITPPEMILPGHASDVRYTACCNYVKSILASLTNATDKLRGEAGVPKGGAV